MALNDLQKAQIRTFLGYPDQHRYLNPRLESAMDSLGPGAEAIVVAEIAEVLAVDLAIKGTTRTVAGIAKADDAAFFSRRDGNRFDGQRREGRMHIGRISKILGVPINFECDYFAIDGYQGDHWSEGQMGYDNPRGVIELKLG